MTRPLLDSGSSPAVSVVLPVLNEEEDIGRLLDELLAQSEPPGGFEVIVADGGSTDGTRRIVDAFASQDTRVRLVENPGVRSSAGRNAGTRAARGHYVVFIDGHCRLPRSDYLVQLLRLFTETDADCLCRPQPLQALAEGKWARAIAAARHSWLGHNPRSDIYRDVAAFTDPRSAGAAYTRQVLLDLGGYDERFDACEDVEFNHRVAQAGLKAYVHPRLRVDYRPRNSLSGLYRQMYRYGRGRAHLMIRYPSVIPWPLVGATILVALLPILGVLAGWGAIGWLVAAGLSLWTLAILAEGARLGGLSLEALEIAMVFPTLHSGLLLGFWRGLCEFSRYRNPPSEVSGPGLKGYREGT